MDQKAILKMINDHKGQTDLLLQFQAYYRGRHKVSDRVIYKHDGTIDLEKTKFSNNKLFADFPGEVIDFMLGYFASKPVKLKSAESKDGKEEPPFLAKLKEIFKLNKYAKVGLEEVKDASIKGKTYELHYTTIENGKLTPHFMKAPAEEMIVNKDDQGNIVQAIRHYDVEVDGKTQTRVTIYTDRDIQYLITEDDASGTLVTKSLVADPIYSKIAEADGTTVLNNTYPHQYKQVPVIEILNNEEEQSDLEKVIDKIDEFDFRVSDDSNELEQYRKAYLKLIGMPGTTNEDLQDAKQAGAWILPEGADVDFVVKQAAGPEADNHLERMAKLIYRGTRTPDFTDENFYTASGLALKLRMLPLEFRCGIKEIYLTEALHKRVELINAILALSGQAGDPSTIEFEFIRNMPLDDQAEVTTNAQLKGLVSEETRLSRLSFIDDPAAELEKLNEEQLQNTPLQLQPFSSPAIRDAAGLEPTPAEGTNNQNSQANNGN